MEIKLKPEEIPQYTGDLEQLEKDHAALKKDAGNIRSAGADVHSHFQGLSAYYKAPEAEQLFATTKPVQDRADGFADDLETVASALSDYADEIRPLVPKLAELKTKARDFIRDHRDDDDADYDAELTAEHNRIRDDITATVAAFWAAERTCYNKIVALWNGPKMVAGDGSKKAHQYGFAAEDMKNAKLPWGDPVEQKHHWYDVGHWVKSFVWDGLIVDGIWGTIKGLGTLVGCDGWEAMGQAWKGLAQLGTGLAILTLGGPGAAAFMVLPDDKLPSWLRDSRTAMKETGKALVAWDEWGKNPGRAAGAVTFNALTTVLTGGAGGAAAGAGKAGSVAKALSVAGKAGKVIDPMTYVGKAAGAGLSKVGDIAKSLKGIGKVDISGLPADALKLPEGTVHLPDGTVHLPEGATLPDGATKLPGGNVKLPDDVPALPENATPVPVDPGKPARYFDGQGNLLDEHGKVLQHIDDAPKEGSPTANPHTGADAPRVEAPVKQPALVGAGVHAVDNAGHHIRVGDSPSNGLGDVGRVSEDATSLRLGDNTPGGGISGHNEGPGTGGGHSDGPSGPSDTERLGENHGASGRHPDDGAHRASESHHDPFASHSDDVSSGDGVHADQGGGNGPAHPVANDAGNGPEGAPLEPQPDWHGQSADQMRHYRHPALDVSHLTPEEQLSVLEHEAATLADEARGLPPGEAPPGQNHLKTGCAGSFLHDNVVTAHSSTTKMHGQGLPHTHKVLADILKQIDDDAKAGVIDKKGSGHGKCAEISLISDRLAQLDPTGTQIRTIGDARRVLDGGVMHTRRIGDFVIKRTGEVRGRHGDYLPPCDTCKHVLPQLGIQPHS
ncbi:YwqJ-related putative deaminase [Streptomyces purpurogeneiscleroticus]|uniref:YwqJ-related putative deaminase n=1 Tax=Streptomyces purpurogeneiscleroticus TaxID=68259 RepID=UPI001CBD9292|nr:YwqJ-related putative deaminase [Streptomyces purpurogeneiscleroticus]